MILMISDIRFAVSLMTRIFCASLDLIISLTFSLCWRRWQRVWSLHWYGQLCFNRGGNLFHRRRRFFNRAGLFFRTRGPNSGYRRQFAPLPWRYFRTVLHFLYDNIQQTRSLMGRCSSTPVSSLCSLVVIWRVRSPSAIAFGAKRVPLHQAVG